jgi:hypothetical protein
MSKKGRIYTEEELHPPTKKHKHTDNCLSALINWFLKIFHFKKKNKEKAGPKEGNFVIIK